ncbi:MAG: phosphate ABC transporter substrate-binding protein [bacterium]|nr:phosphate ABC transporter substrate-binding protein [bacterium]
MKKLLVVLTVLVIGMAFLWTATAQDSTAYRVIVHQDNQTSTVSKSEVSNLLLKKKLRWESGDDAEPVDLDSKSAVREAFSRDVHGRSVSSIKNYWQRQIFSGREVPPPEVSSDADVVAFVRGHPGGIGYVSPNARLSGVKVVSISG